MRTVLGLRVFWRLIVAALIIAGLGCNGSRRMVWLVRMVDGDTPATAEARLRFIRWMRRSSTSCAATDPNKPFDGGRKTALTFAGRAPGRLARHN